MNIAQRSDVEPRLRKYYGWLCCKFRRAMLGKTSQYERDEIEKEIALVEALLDFYDDIKKDEK